MFLLILSFPSLTNAASITERTIIDRFDNQVFSLPDELTGLADDDTIEVGGEKLTKGDLKNAAKVARECHQFHTALLNDLQILSIPDKDVTNPIIVVAAHSSSMDRKQGPYKSLLDKTCGSGGNAFFAEKIYPHVFNELKSQSANSLGASVNLYLSGGTLDNPKENDVRLEKLAKRHGVVIAANDDKFVIGAAMGDTRAIGKTYLYEGFLTVKRKGYYEVMGIPVILLQASPALDKFGMGDKIVAVIKITGSKKWFFSSGDLHYTYTGRLIKLLPQ